MLWHSIDTQHPVHSIRYGSRESELKQPFHSLVKQYRAHKLKWKKKILTVMHSTYQNYIFIRNELFRFKKDFFYNMYVHVLFPYVYKVTLY